MAVYTLLLHCPAKSYTPSSHKSCTFICDFFVVVCTLISRRRVAGQNLDRAIELATSATFSGINSVDSNGCSALHHAVKVPSLALLQGLLDNPAFKAVDRQTFPEAKPDGWTALHVVAWSACPDPDSTWKITAAGRLLQALPHYSSESMVLLLLID